MARLADFNGIKLRVEVPEGAHKVRVGLPKPNGALVANARAKGYPVLVSSNAFAKRDADGYFAGWRPARNLAGLDVALDSAGFVAWARYGGFDWAVGSYLDLVAAFPWSWWAQMDACCEKEIAGDRRTVRMRQAETIRLLARCERAARDRGLPPPVKVLQGAEPADYIWHARQVLDGSERLIGVGSMCRRPLHGPNGLIAVVRALDAELPQGTKLHLFGIKTAGLRALAHHPRIASVDSMAWSTRARKLAHEAGRSNSIAHKVEVMDEWAERQLGTVLGSPAAKVEPEELEEREGFDDLTEEWAELVEAGEIDLASALHHMAWERYARGEAA